MYQILKNLDSSSKNLKDNNKISQAQSKGRKQIEIGKNHWAKMVIP
jgi:hypothetical protein